MRRLLWYIFLIALGFGAYHFTLGRGEEMGRHYLGLAGERLSDLASGTEAGSPCTSQQTLDRLRNLASNTLNITNLELRQPQELSRAGTQYTCAVVVEERLRATYTLDLSTGSDVSQAEIKNLQIKANL